jgi:hypothetical protein
MLKIVLPSGTFEVVGSPRQVQDFIIRAVFCRIDPRVVAQETGVTFKWLTE